MQQRVQGRIWERAMVGQRAARKVVQERLLGSGHNVNDTSNAAHEKGYSQASNINIISFTNTEAAEGDLSENTHGKTQGTKKHQQHATALETAPHLGAPAHFNQHCGSHLE